MTRAQEIRKRRIDKRKIEKENMADMVWNWILDEFDKNTSLSNYKCIKVEISQDIIKVEKDEYRMTGMEPKELFGMIQEIVKGEEGYKLSEMVGCTKKMPRFSVEILD